MADVKDVEEALAKIFGSELVERYYILKRRFDRIPKSTLDKIKKYAKENFRHSNNLALKYNNYDILLVFAPYSEDMLKVTQTTTGDYRVVALWYGADPAIGPFLNIFTSHQEMASQIVRESGAATVICGKLRETEYDDNKKGYNFWCQGVILVPTEIGKSKQKEKPKEKPAEKSTEKPKEKPREKPKEKPIEKPEDKPEPEPTSEPEPEPSPEEIEKKINEAIEDVVGDEEELDKLLDELQPEGDLDFILDEE